MRLLVTGGAGFIGSHLVRAALEEGWEVTVLDLLTYAGNRANLPPPGPRWSFVRGDVRDGEALRRLLPGHEAVVHCAAESHVDRSIAGATEFTSTNVLGTHTVLEAARRAGVGPLVVVSTDEVYGSIAEGAWDEEQPLRPNSPYAASKAGADLVALAYHRTHGTDVRITRCANNYGPRQHPEKLIPHFVTRLLTGGRVPLYGEGANVREWLHVEDHCRALLSVLADGSPGGVYNIGGGTELTNREMTGRLLRLCGADWDRVDRVPDRAGHDLRYALDDGRIRRELGYAPQVPFEDGLAATVEWYRANPSWWEPAVRAAG
ncbi:dTDP-glucose 4,6-dehydratase [Streptomyces sp. NPDC059740]|uniref:dTDP-glucose 4,6-dehydratase n=1 Tax=Streptomyces sp. NPDC059740 TaxID=3346926 RepID=UPI003650DAB6